MDRQSKIGILDAILSVEHRGGKVARVGVALARTSSGSRAICGSKEVSRNGADVGISSFGLDSLDGTANSDQRELSKIFGRLRRLSPLKECNQ